MNKIKTILAVVTLLAVPVMASVQVFALDGKAKTGFETGIVKSGGTSGSTVSVFVQNIINLLLFIAGIIAVVVIVIGGLRYVLSNGDAGAASKARNAILYAVIGLVVAIMAYAIVNFILVNI
ncbi:MAG: hypothetical protein Q7T74_07540 [Candidatus Saccharibacteria bacterium]|nr:hypothetical protein [Candidatus Saccharibacteria bacterium]